VLLLHRLLLLFLLVAALGGFILQAPANTPTLVMVLMGAVIYGPLLIFVRPAWRADPRQLLWFCILLMFYFCGYSMQVLSPAPLIYWVIARLALVVALFTTSSLLIRRLKKTSSPKP